VNEPVWDDHPWPGLPALRGQIDADLCVIGLGGSGLAAIGQALAHGQSVVGVDAGTVAGAAAGRNGGFLLAGLAHGHHKAGEQLGRRLAARLYQMTLDELDRLSAETPDAVRRTGSVRIADSPAEAEDCRRQADALAADGFPVEAYTGPEGTGLLFPRDGAMQPLLRCRMVAQAHLAAGATLAERTRAIDIAGSQVTTADATIRCRGVVIAVDGGLEHLVPALAGEVRTARLQMLATEPTDEVALPRPVYARWGYDYWQQLPDGRLALGGQRDRFADREWTLDGAPTDEVQAALDRLLRDRVGVQRARVTARWAAPAGFRQGGLLPVFRQVSPHLWAVGGYSGTGNVVGSLYGRAAAGLALGLPRDGDLDGLPVG
jgi:glycine/D-amino acid oxidase-like deaminating enzyme